MFTRLFGFFKPGASTRSLDEHVDEIIKLLKTKLRKFQVGLNLTQDITETLKSVDINDLGIASTSCSDSIGKAEIRKLKNIIKEIKETSADKLGTILFSKEELELLQDYLNSTGSIKFNLLTSIKSIKFCHNFIKGMNKIHGDICLELEENLNEILSDLTAFNQNTTPEQRENFREDVANYIFKNTVYDGNTFTFPEISGKLKELVKKINLPENGNHIAMRVLGKQ
ncbi:MAG: hypothetical protein KIT27_01400 [Legionellales bacterium]|nr:hypothetical protein [Legionellales bacterium]